MDLALVRVAIKPIIIARSREVLVLVRMNSFKFYSSMETVIGCLEICGTMSCDAINSEQHSEV